MEGESTWNFFPLEVAVILCVCCCARYQDLVKKWLFPEPAATRVMPEVPHQALGAFDSCLSSPWQVLSLPPNKVDSASSGGRWELGFVSQPAGLRESEGRHSITDLCRCRHTLISINSVYVIYVDPNKAAEMQISCLMPHQHAPNLPVLLSAAAAPPLGPVGDAWCCDPGRR